MSEESAAYRVTREPLSDGDLRKRGMFIVHGIECTEIHRPSSQGRAALIGYVIRFGKQYDAYGRSIDDSLIYFGSFDRLADAEHKLLGN